MMPDLDGAQLFEVLQAIDPFLKCIIMSGHPEPQQAQPHLQQRVLAWVQKPPSPDQLAQLLALFL
jgi:DNA-binding NtrC family response regulator